MGLLAREGFTTLGSQQGPGDGCRARAVRIWSASWWVLQSDVPPVSAGWPRLRPGNLVAPTARVAPAPRRVQRTEISNQPSVQARRPSQWGWIDPEGQQQLVSVLLGVKNHDLQLPLAVCAVRPGARRAGQAAEHPRTIPSAPTLRHPKPFPEQPPPAYSHTPVGNYPQGSFINPDVSFHCWCPSEGRAQTPRFSSTRLPFISGAD